MHLFSSRDFMAFGSYSEEQIRTMARQTGSHRRIENLIGGRIPRVGHNFRSRYGPHSKFWSIWFVVKRSILAAVIFQSIGYLFDKIKPHLDEGITQFFSELQYFFSPVANIIWPREEEVSPPSVSGASKDLWNGLIVPIFFWEFSF